MPLGLGDGFGGGRGGFDYLNAVVKSRTQLNPRAPDDPIRPGQRRRRVLRAIVAVIAIAAAVVVVILAL